MSFPGVAVSLGVSTAAVGVGAGVFAAGPGVAAGSGHGSIPHSRPAVNRAVPSATSPAFISSVMAFAISAGPPSSAMMHTIPSRSSGSIPSLGAAAAHSSSFRQAIATVNAAILPAMAVWASPSSPAVITGLGSMTSSAARTQLEVSSLSGTGTMVVMKIRSTVSSSRHPMSRACSSMDAGPLPVRAAIIPSGSPPMQASSASDRLESKAF